jgi:Flp pilus assembly protein TadB
MRYSRLTVVLALTTAGALIFAIYTYSRIQQLQKENERWKAKYEEAIIDAEEAVQRIRQMEQQMADSLAHANREKQALQQQLEQATMRNTRR